MRTWDVFPSCSLPDVLLILQDWLPSGLQGPSCLCLPSGGIRGTCSHFWLFTWVLGAGCWVLGIQTQFFMLALLSPSPGVFFSTE